MGTGMTKLAVTVAAIVSAITVPQMAPKVSAAAAKPVAAPSATITNTLATPEGSYYRPVTPTRLLDANASNAIRLNAGASTTVDVTGVGGVPATGVAAVLVDLAGSRATLPTTLTIAASGAPAPTTTSNLELVPLVTADNPAIVPVGSDGNVVIRNSAGRVYVGLDLLGWFPTSTDLHTVQPSRLVDTRNGSAADTPVRSGSPLAVTVAGRGGVPATGVGMAVVNVTALDASATTSVSLYARGAAVPQVANMDVPPLLPTSDLAIVPIGTGGAISVANTTGKTNVIVDVLGWFPTTTDVHLIAPQPLLNTRPDRWSGRLGANADLDVQVAGRAGIPLTGVNAVILSVSAIAATRSTVVTVHPTGSTRPPTSSIEVPPLLPADNLVVVPLGTGGKVRVHNSAGSVHVAVDVFGWLPEDPAPTTGSWVFQPADVMFTAAGQTATVDLVHRDTTGSLTGAPVPSGVTTAITGATGVVTMTEVARGRYRLTATAAIGLASVAATVPGITAVAQLDVATTQLQTGVQVIDVARVVFPPADGATSNTGPFTTAELSARTLMPTQQELAAASNPFAVDARLPVVLTGAAPTAGSVIISSDGTRFAGRVVEPAGIPTLSRSGHVLISLEATSLLDVFRKLDVHVEGSVPVPQAPAAPLARSSLVAPEPSGPCETEAEATTGTFDLQSNPDVRLLADANVNADAQTAHFEIGYVATVSVSMKATFQAAVTASLTCTVLKLPSSGFGVPPLAAVLTAFIAPRIDLKLELTASGGPRVEVEASCNAFRRQVVTFDYAPSTGAVGDTQVVDPTPTCTKSAKVIDNSGVGPVTVDLTAGLYLVIDVGVRVGGKLAELIGSLIQDDDLGEVGLFKLSLGPRLHLMWENGLQVLAAEKSESKLALELALHAGVEIPALNGLVRSITGNEDASVSIASVDVVLPLVTFYRPPAQGPLRITVNDVVVGEPVVVKPGDTVAFSEVLGWEGDSAPIEGDATVTAATDWLASTGVLGSFDRLNLFELSLNRGTNTTLTGTATIDQARCNSLGPDKRKVAFLADAPMLGLFSTNGFAGAFELQCKPPTIEFDRDTLTFETQQVGSPVTVHLAGHDLASGDWSIATPPAWLSVTPGTGDFVSADETDDVVVKVDCTKVNPRAEVDTTLIANAHRPSDTKTYSDRLDVHADCRNDLLDFQPSTSTGDADVTLSSRGPTASTWELSGVPTWAKITPTSGDLPVGTSVRTLHVDITQRAAQCVNLPERRVNVTATSPDRGTAILTIVDPKVPPHAGCGGPTTTGSSGGDPHMGSMDGVRYDAQVLGEYVYLRPAAGSTGATVQVRHDYTSGSGGFARPTSLVGVVVGVDGHAIEVLSRPDEVRLDGVATVLASGVPVAIAENLSITDDGIGGYLISAADLGVTVRRGLMATLNLWITAPIGAPYVGLLGAPDGNAANDLTPAGSSTSYTRADIDGHAPPLYVLTDSWRLTDPDMSLFTRPWDGFDAANPPYNEAQLDPFKQQVIDHLQPVGAVCDGDSAADSYVVRALAIELAIGSGLDVLDTFTCRFVVSGRIISPAGDVVSGVPVTVDAPGLTGCTTTTTSTGSYACTLTPASAELSPAPSFPLPVNVEARWPDDGTLAASGTTTFPAKAGFDTAAVQTLDVVLDDSSLPRITLHGTMTGLSGPVAGPVNLTVIGSDSTGRITGYGFVQVMPDATTGNYELLVPEPHGTTQVQIGTRLGVTNFSKRVTDLHAGLQDVEFSIDHRPTTLAVSGAMHIAGVPFHGPMLVSIEAFGDSGQLIAVIDTYVAIDETTGGYSLTKELPSTARSALITVLIGSRTDDWKRLSIPTLTPGLQQVPFDVDVHPTDLVLHGQLRYLGAPVDGLVAVTAYFSGTSLASQLVASSGQYSGSIRLPEGVSQAHVMVTLEASGVATVVTRDVTLTAGTVNDVTWDIDVSSLTVQGTASVDGQPLVDTSIPAELQLLDSTDAPIGDPTFMELFTDEFGAYSFQVPIDSQAHTAELTVHFDPETTRVYRLAGLHAGAINRTLDIDPSFALSLTLRGQILDEQGGPQFGVVDVTVAFLDVSGAVADLLTETSAELDPDGFYVIAVPLPPGATHARVELVPSGHDEDWVVVVPLTGSAQEQVFDIDRQGPRIQLVGDIRATDGCIPSRVEPRLILIAFPSDPVGNYDPQTFEWPGGARVYDSLVIADPYTGRFGVGASLPPGTTRVAIIQVDDQLAFMSSAVLPVDPALVTIWSWDLMVC